MKPITIIIPNKYDQVPKLTLESLYEQTFKEFDIVIINDFDGNACKARNEGFKHVDTPYVLFSDNDLIWAKDGVATLYNTLVQHPECSWSYSKFMLGKNCIGNKPFDPASLFNKNYITGNSLFVTKDFPGWDENIKKLQDWDVFLTLTENGKKGIFCDKIIFETPIRDGISNTGIHSNVARQIVLDKHSKKEIKKIIEPNIRRRILR